MIKIFSKEKLKVYVSEFIISLFACVTTLYIWNYSKINNILICEVLVLSYTLLFPEHHADMFFSASLAGISSETYLPNPGFVFLLGLVTFVVFNILKKVFIGYGGKLGTIAFISNLLVCYFAFLGGTDHYPFFDFRYYQSLDVYIYVFGPLICATSTYFSYLIHNYCHLTKFIAINVDGILYSLVLITIKETPKYDGNDFFLSYGTIFNIFSHIGLLIALLKEEFLLKFAFQKYLFYQYFLIGYLGGWIFIAVFGFFPVGGKNGFVSFLACNFYVRTLKFSSRLFKSKSKNFGKVQNEGVPVEKKENNIFVIERKEENLSNNLDNLQKSEDCKSKSNKENGSLSNSCLDSESNIPETRVDLNKDSNENKENENVFISEFNIETKS